MLFITLHYTGKIAVVIFYSSKIETDIINETKITILITVHVFVPSFVNRGQSAHAMIFFVTIRPSAPRSQSAGLRCDDKVEASQKVPVRLPLFLVFRLAVPSDPGMRLWMHHRCSIDPCPRDYSALLCSGQVQQHRHPNL